MLFLNLLLSRVLFNYLSKYYCPGPWTQIRLCPFLLLEKGKTKTSRLLRYLKHNSLARLARAVDPRLEIPLYFPKSKTSRLYCYYSPKTAQVVCTSRGPK